MSYFNELKPILLIVCACVSVVVFLMIIPGSNNTCESLKGDAIALKQNILKTSLIDSVEVLSRRIGTKDFTVSRTKSGIMPINRGLNVKEFRQYFGDEQIRHQWLQMLLDSKVGVVVFKEEQLRFYKDLNFYRGVRFSVNYSETFVDSSIVMYTNCNDVYSQGGYKLKVSNNWYFEVVQLVD